MKKWKIEVKTSGVVFPKNTFLDVFSILSMTEEISLEELKVSLQSSDKFETDQYLVTKGAGK